ncbi:hypothetical protein [Microbacterium sp. bgisy203]|uniref:hypothetical protein n=1 Tax=Microbacterium sp. bgisy203 TaxID=3413799 RepID=UPI003D7452E1
MSEPITAPASRKVLRASIWVAIGALIAAALVSVVWVLIGDDNGIVGKAFLTILLLAGFAGVAILEANLAARRPAWLALASMISWVLVLLIGAFLIWMPTDGQFGIGADRFFRYVLIILIIQGALLHARLFVKAYLRYQTTFTTIVAYVTIGLVVILAIMLVLPLVTAEYVDIKPLYWRVVVALAILAAVGTALIPLVNALFAPKKERPAPPTGYGAAPYAAPAPQAWPTFVDGVTPLPVLPDGTPDWNAYYTGYPTYPQPELAAAPVAPPQDAAPQVYPYGYAPVSPVDPYAPADPQGFAPAADPYAGAPAADPYAGAPAPEPYAPGPEPYAAPPADPNAPAAPPVAPPAADPYAPAPPAPPVAPWYQGYPPPPPAPPAEQR